MPEIALIICLINVCVILFIVDCLKCIKEFQFADSNSSILIFLLIKPIFLLS
ncbi:hypothetical protein VAA_03705 [Vibrio anguillarum 775]|nr:hypothetical protein VAA_03705 [Vibrio anguillarum 775]AGU58802.1 hypothetical protein N175_04095 [Vibrio anguillarum M3]ARV26308.1 putative membrane protein [Vibrio anguillarum]